VDRENEEAGVCSVHWCQYLLPLSLPPLLLSPQSLHVLQPPLLLLFL
jgi:hypothetical protein